MNRYRSFLSLFMSKHIKGKGEHLRYFFWNFELFELFVPFCLHMRNQISKVSYFFSKFFYFCIAPRKNEAVAFPGINNEKDAKNVLPKDSFILERWVNFQSLEKEGFLVKGIFDRVRWTNFLWKLVIGNKFPMLYSRELLVRKESVSEAPLED